MNHVQEIADLTPEEEATLFGVPGHVTGVVGSPFGGKLGERIRVVRRKIVNGLIQKGMTREDAIETVGKLGDGHILELIIKYGPDIMKIVMAILAMF